MSRSSNWPRNNKRLVITLLLGVICTTPKPWGFVALGRAADCHVALDVAFLIDNTLSMGFKVDTIRQFTSTVASVFAAEYSGSRFGLATFNSRSVECGSLNGSNYCARADLGFVRDLTSLKSSISSISYDHVAKEANKDGLEGLIVAALDSKMEWRMGPGVAHIVVVLTDAGFFQPGDPYFCRPASLAANTGGARFDCAMQEFPSVTQAAAALKSRRVYPFIITSKDSAATWKTFLDTADLGGLVSDYFDGGRELMAFVKQIVDSTECPDESGPRHVVVPTPTGLPDLPWVPTPKAASESDDHTKSTEETTTNTSTRTSSSSSSSSSTERSTQTDKKTTEKKLLFTTERPTTEKSTEKSGEKSAEKSAEISTTKKPLEKPTTTSTERHTTTTERSTTTTTAEKSVMWSDKSIASEKTATTTDKPMIDHKNTAGEAETAPHRGHCVDPGDSSVVYPPSGDKAALQDSPEAPPQH